MGSNSVEIMEINTQETVEIRMSDHYDNRTGIVDVSVRIIHHYLNGRSPVGLTATYPVGKNTNDLSYYTEGSGEIMNLKFKSGEYVLTGDAINIIVESQGESILIDPVIPSIATIEHDDVTTFKSGYTEILFSVYYPIDDHESDVTLEEMMENWDDYN